MSPDFRCEAISWRQVDQLLRTVAEAIRAARFQPELIVAIARGGFVPARLLCDQLGVMELASFRIEHYQGQQREARARVRHPLNVELGGRRVLVVDDLSDTGETFEVAMQHILERGASEARSAALHYKLGSKVEPDFYAKRVRQWRWLSYPWARMEDLTGLMGKLETLPDSPEQAMRELRSRYGLRVPKGEVVDALRLMGRSDV